MLRTVLKTLRGSAEPAAPPVERQDSLIYSLESPTYPLAGLDAVNDFTGWVFCYGDKVVRELRVFREAAEVGRFPVAGVREDVARHAPRIPAARTSGFRFELHLDSGAPCYRFECGYDDGSREPLFEYDIREILRLQDSFARMNASLESQPMPPPELIFLTQGHREIDVYRNSIIPGFFNLRRYLEQAGVDFHDLHSVLDFGCGSGRLLLGWYLHDASLQLCGCDINEQLTDWAKQSLPEEIRVETTALQPPLSFADRQFDLIYLISVFTHLSLDNQRRWIEEFKRILKPGGYLLLSLHGEIYMRHIYGEASSQYEEFRRTGYMDSPEQAEGSNAFGAFHARRFVTELFGTGFRLLGDFPNGSIRGQRTLFRIALAQDVYVLQYRTG